MSEGGSPAEGTPDARTVDQVIALAGLFQSVHLVQRIARHGLADAVAFETCVSSVLRIDAGSTAAVYGGLDAVATGLRALRDQLAASARDRDMELTAYVARLLNLERRLAARPETVGRLREGIERIEPLAESHGAGAQSVVDALAALYVETIGEVGPRVMVGGDAEHLRDPRNAARIRVLLLSGVRATVLWRQVGGSKLGLLLGRNRLLRAATALAADLAR